MLELRRLQIHRNDAPLFAPLDMQVPAGQVGVVMGPSGVGKSTLLDAIGGIWRAVSPSAAISSWRGWIWPDRPRRPAASA